MEAMSWQILIPRALSSRNETAKAHRWARSKARDLWAADLKAVKRALGIPDATGVRIVQITRLLGKGKKFHDKDNTDVKPLLDAMKPERIQKGKAKNTLVPGAGLILDDRTHGPNPKLVLREVEQRRADNGQPATLIVIEDAP
jgi:hypothetical protein